MRTTAETEDLRAVTRATSNEAGDWGRALALAFEYLSVQVAFREDVPATGVLLGRNVSIHIESNGAGVVLIARLEQTDV